MSLLTQCPRCNNAYVRRSDDTAETITCRRCLFEFRPAAAKPVASAPVVTIPLPAPIVVSSLPTDFVIQIEADHVHDVEHIEVLESPQEVPAAPKPVQAPALSAPADPAMPGSLELDDVPALKPLTDDVEVVEGVPVVHPVGVHPITPADEAALEPLPEAAAQAPMALDHVHVIEEAGGAPQQQGVQASPATVAPVFTEVEPPEPALPPRRDPPRRIDIRKRAPERRSAAPAGVWIGLGIGIFALCLLVLVIVIVLGSGSSQQAPGAPPKQPAAPAAAPPHDIVPRPEDRPTAPDQRGPAPWTPAPRGAAAPPAATQFDGLVGYWPCDEGKGVQVADGSTNHSNGTLIGGWWIDGVRGKAIVFDGQRDYLDLGNTPLLNVPRDGPFTVAGWLATRQRDGYFLAFRNPREPAPMIQVKLSGGRLTGVVRADGSETGEARVGLASAADGRWHHFAVVRHPGGLIECFLDGQSIDKRGGANSAGPITTTVRSVGSERALALTQRSATAFFAGAIDELCMFQRALTPKEVGALAGK